jgi:hypothetical protein
LANDSPQKAKYKLSNASESASQPYFQYFNAEDFNDFVKKTVSIVIRQMPENWISKPTFESINLTGQSPGERFRE